VRTKWTGGGQRQKCVHGVSQEKGGRSCTHKKEAVKAFGHRKSWGKPTRPPKIKPLMGQRVVVEER